MDAISSVFDDFEPYIGTNVIQNDENSTLEDILGIKDIVLENISEADAHDLQSFGEKLNLDRNDEYKNTVNLLQFKTFHENNLTRSNQGPLISSGIFQQQSMIANPRKMETRSNKHISKYGTQNTQLQCVGSVQSADKIPSLPTEEPTSPLCGKSGIQCNEGPGMGNLPYTAQPNPPMVKLHEKSKLHKSRQSSIALHHAPHPLQENYATSRDTYPLTETDLKSKKQHSHKQKPYDNFAVAVSKSKHKKKEHQYLFTGNDHSPNGNVHVQERNVYQMLVSENNQAKKDECPSINIVPENNQAKKDECPSISSTMKNLAIEDPPVPQLIGDNIGCYEETVGASPDNSDEFNLINSNILTLNNDKESNEIPIADTNYSVNTMNSLDTLNENRNITEAGQILQSFICSGDSGQFQNKSENLLNDASSIDRIVHDGQTLMSDEEIDHNIQQMQSYITTGDNIDQFNEIISDCQPHISDNSELHPENNNNQLFSNFNDYLPGEEQIPVMIANLSRDFPVTDGEACQSNADITNINSNQSQKYGQSGTNAFEIQSQPVDSIPSCENDLIIGDQSLIKSLEDDNTESLKHVDENGMVTISFKQYKALMELKSRKSSAILDLDDIDLLDPGITEDILNGILPFGVSEMGLMQADNSNDTTVETSVMSPEGSEEHYKTTEDLNEEITIPDIPEIPQGQSDYESFAIPSTVEEMASETEAEEGKKDKAKKSVKTKSSKNEKTRSFQKPLWEFLLDVLANRQHNPSVICWLDQTKGIFKIVKGKELANLWTAARNREASLKYEFFARAMRHYYKKGILKRIAGKKLQYMFCENHDWHTYNKKTCANKAQ